MSAQLLLQQARTILSECLQVTPGEDVLILWDETVSPALADACRITANEIGARPYLLTFEPMSHHPLKEYCLFAGASLRQNDVALPTVLTGALAQVEAVVLLISEMEFLFAPGWGELLRDRQTEGGKRFVFVPYLDDARAYRLLPRSAEEVADIKELVERGAAAFRKTDTAHVASAEGTDLHLQLGQYEVRLHTGVAEPGSLQLLPAGQVTCVPNDGSANGTLVIDRTIADNDYRELTEPIVFTVQDGRVTRIEGGLEAKRLRHFMDSLDDSNMYHVTELGIGTNARCTDNAVGAPAEDTHALGTVSFALGCDVHIGGQVRGPAHIDMTMHFPTLKLDEEILVREGRLQIE